MHLIVGDDAQLNTERALNLFDYKWARDPELTIQHISLTPICKRHAERLAKDKSVGDAIDFVLSLLSRFKNNQRTSHGHVIVDGYPPVTVLCDISDYIDCLALFEQQNNCAVTATITTSIPVEAIDSFCRHYPLHITYSYQKIADYHLAKIRQNLPTQ